MQIKHLPPAIRAAAERKGLGEMSPDEYYRQYLEHKQRMKRILGSENARFMIEAMEQLRKEGAL